MDERAGRARIKRVQSGRKSVSMHHEYSLKQSEKCTGRDCPVLGASPGQLPNDKALLGRGGREPRSGRVVHGFIRRPGVLRPWPGHGFRKLE